jgi:hypothetical protein
MREKKGVVGATFSRPLAAECRPYVIHAIALGRDVDCFTDRTLLQLYLCLDIA